MFGFDTEFVGEDKYDPEICLIQAATDSFCVLIDPLGDLDVSPFWHLVADAAAHVVVHAGSEDLALCWKQIAAQAANVFDVQIGAGLVGLGYPISLSRLARLTLGVKLHKSQTLTDWRKRPLTHDQIDYAVEDVAHLLAMYRLIHDRLVQLGREEWGDEECVRVCQAATLAARGEQKLRRLRGAGGLNRRELAIAEALLEERDKLAQEYNRPARGVLRDHLLVELARRGWTKVARIQTLRGVNLKAAGIRRLAVAIEQAQQLPEDQWPALPTEEDNTEEETLLPLLTAVLRDHCYRNKLSYALLASKGDLRAFVRTYTRTDRTEDPILLQTGWRKAAVGDLLDRVLSGRCALRITCERNKRGLNIE